MDRESSSEATPVGADRNRRSNGPPAATVRCAACDAELDALRAGHVAIFDSKLRYFCNRSVCRARFLGEAPSQTPPLRRASVPPPPPGLVASVMPATAEVARREELPDVVEHAADELVEPVPVIAESDDDMPVVEAPEREMHALLLGLTLVAGLLAMALELAEPTRFVRVARLVLVGLATTTIAGRSLSSRGIRTTSATGSRTDAARPSSVATTAPAFGALVVAVVGHTFFDISAAGRAIFLAATIVSIDAGVAFAIAAASRGVERRRAWLERRTGGETGALARREGAPLLLSAGDVVDVDLVVSEGEATVSTWVRGGGAMRRRPGDWIAAGSRVVAGSVRGVVARIGDERAVMRAVFGAAHRPDVHVDLARIPRVLVERWAPGLGLVAGGLRALLGGAPLDAAMVAVAVHAALASAAVAVLPSLTVARGVLDGVERGILFASAAAWDLASKATVAVFCARGTLLRGEPELVEVELFASASTEARADAVSDMLALAAAALAGERSPLAWAIKRAARQRGLSTDFVRNVRAHDGRGVTGVSSTGEAVCVGSRELMLERRVSVAVAEDAIAKLESSGRSVVLVAKSGRLIGLCALQDGLRAGARAAVQHLLDARIEPVLMSSDTAATCDALGKALDIDHLRAELRDDEAGEAVARIRDTGALVAVVGHSPIDEVALKAADVSVVLGIAGREPDEAPTPEPRIMTVHDDVRAGALAVALSHACRRRTSSAVFVVLGPAIFGTLVVTLGLLSAEYAPLAQLLGALTAAWPLIQDEDEP